MSNSRRGSTARQPLGPRRGRADLKHLRAMTEAEIRRTSPPEPKNVPGGCKNLDPPVVGVAEFASAAQRANVTVFAMNARGLPSAPAVPAQGDAALWASYRTAMLKACVQSPNLPAVLPCSTRQTSPTHCSALAAGCADVCE
jgi:hypothetical protein